MGLIWIETENEFLIRYQKIRRYFEQYKNNELSREEYEVLKTEQFDIDDWKTWIYKLEDNHYNAIMLEALIDIHELYNDGAITKTEYETQKRKVRLRQPATKLPPDFFK